MTMSEKELELLRLNRNLMADLRTAKRQLASAERLREELKELKTIWEKFGSKDGKNSVYSICAKGLTELIETD